MEITENNYFSKEVCEIYTGSTEIKEFLKCEACALAKLNGEFEEEKSKAMLVSSYIDESIFIFTGTPLISPVIIT